MQVKLFLGGIISAVFFFFFGLLGIIFNKRSILQVMIFVELMYLGILLIFKRNLV